MTLQDLGTVTYSGSASALNADLIVSTKVSGYKTASIQITGTFVGAVSFQGSNDNTNFENVYAQPAGMPNNGQPVISTTITGIYHLPLNFEFLRIRMTSYTSGTATATVLIFEDSIGETVGPPPAIIEDLQTYQYANVDLRNELRTTTSFILIGGEFVNNSLDTNNWSTTLIGSGTATTSANVEQLATGTTANSSAFLASINRARFVAGTVHAFYSSVRLGDTGVVNNIRRWGVYDSSDGIFFALNGTTVEVGIRNAGVDTIVTQASFNGQVPFVLDTNFHRYEIQYTAGNAFFYQDNNLIHTYTALTSSLSSTPNYFLGFESTNSGGGTSNASLYIRSPSVIRYGEEHIRPRYFHPFYTSRIQTASASTTATVASLTVNINPTKAGSLLVVSAAREAGALTCTDSASQTYSTATSQTLGVAQTFVFYVANSVAGVTSVTINTSPTSTDRMLVIVSEYVNIVSSSALDQVSSNTNTAVTSWTSNNTPATTQAVELLVGSAWSTLHNNQTFTQGTGWTQVNLINGTGGGNTLTGFTEEQYVTSTGTYAATGTNGTSDNILAAIATFKTIPSTLSSGLTVANNPTLLKNSAGILRSVIINSLGTGTANVTFYDNTTNSGQVMAVVSLTDHTGVIDYDINFNNGLTIVVNSTTADFTVVYD